MVETSILAMFGTNSSIYSISQKLFFKLTTISPRKTQDSFKIDTQNLPKLEKVGLHSFQTQKGILVLDNYQKKSWI